MTKSLDNNNNLRKNITKVLPLRADKEMASALLLDKRLPCDSFMENSLNAEITSIQRLYEVLMREHNHAAKGHAVKTSHSIIEQCDIDSLPSFSDDPLAGNPMFDDELQAAE